MCDSLAACVCPRRSTVDMSRGGALRKLKGICGAYTGYMLDPLGNGVLVDGGRAVADVGVARMFVVFEAMGPVGGVATIVG